MPHLAVVAYPSVDSNDGEWIESLRHRHDPQATLIPAHLTLVFPVHLDAVVLASEVAAIARRTPPVLFTLRSATAVRDLTGSGGHVFLVPHEGFDQIRDLHTDLHRGVCAASLRPDIPFIPHVTIAADADFTVCEGIAERLTLEPRQVHGELTTVSLIEITSPTVRTLEEFPLEG